MKTRTRSQSNGRAIPALKSVSVPVSLLALALATGLSACGGMRTNPTEDYPELQGAVVPGQAKPLEFEVMPAALVSIDDKGKNLIWSVGQAKSYTLVPSTSTSLQGVRYELVSQDLPTWLKLRQEAPNSTNYILEGTPPASELGSNDFKDYRINVEFKITNPGNARNAQLLQRGAILRRSFSVVVVQSSDQPVFESVRVAKDVIEEGESTEITAVVNDPASASGGRRPQVAFVDDDTASTEGGLVQAKRMVVEVSNRNLGGGKWEYRLVLNTAEITGKLPGNEPIVPARFEMLIRSDARLSSIPKVVEVKIRRKAAQAARPAAPAQASAPRRN